MTTLNWKRATLPFAALGILLCARLAAEAGQTVLLPPNSTWKYLVTPTAPDSSWVEPTHVDSSWAVGPGILGYGEAFIDTPIGWGPNAADKYRTTYFRTEFDVVDPGAHQTFSLGANFDDGFVCYLNGEEITRKSMPAGPITYDTFAFQHEGGAYERFNLPGAIAFLVAGSNQFAIELHQASPASSDLVFDFDLVTTSAPAILTRGPYLQVGTPTSVIIRWRTADVTDSRVTYGLSPAALTSTVDDLTPTTEHEVLVPALAPGTRHYYTIGTTAGVVAGGDSTFSFRSSPVVGTGGPTRVWIVGDSGEANQSARDVRDAYLGHPESDDTHVWLMLGDNAYQTGTDVQYQAAVFDTYPQILRNTIVWPTRGNHDQLHTGSNNDYYEIFTMPANAEAGGVVSGSEAYYSFDHANIHFVCLDSEGSDRTVAGPMLIWLAQDLAATRQDWIIAYFHHPPYSKGSHDSDDPSDSGGRLFDMRQNALPILEAGGVDLVLCGHSHSYERSFLIDGHYDVSDSLKPSMILDGGDGRVGSGGAYPKATLGPAGHEGTVYAVPGSSSKISGGPLDHPAMFISLNVLGSLVLDIEDDQLDATFIDETGTVQDFFTIQKGVDTGSEISPQASTRLQLSRSEPNPFRSETILRYVIPSAGEVRLDVYDAQGRRVRSLVNAVRPAGNYTVSWDGRNSRGNSVAPGVYFGALAFEGEMRARKLIRAR